ncbi:3-dehydrosphinganine reductase tsc10a [Quercus suber]|uniref:3-dehydrosphinganine reductase tsc10a n=1 Tax=Quercus suber TaxID=58331 RepID=A0AAW0KI86_QUESU
MSNSNFFLLLLLPLLLLLILYILVRPRPVKIPIKNCHATSKGACVSILTRFPNKLEEVKQAIRLSTSINVVVFVADVRDYNAVSKAISEVNPIDV